jgi:hypothetical protein
MEPFWGLRRANSNAFGLGAESFSFQRCMLTMLTHLTLSMGKCHLGLLRQENSVLTSGWRAIMRHDEQIGAV